MTTVGLRVIGVGASAARRSRRIASSRGRARCRGGFTLLEVLGSLALLSLIAGAGLAVCQSVLRSTGGYMERDAWGRAAVALLDSIAADLNAGDFDPIGDRARGLARVRVLRATEVGAFDELRIRTRDPGHGACDRRYIVGDGRVSVQACDRVRARSGVVASALGSVDAVEIEILTDPPLLRVRLQGRGRTVSRLYALTKEDVP